MSISATQAKIIQLLRSNPDGLPLKSITEFVALSQNATSMAVSGLVEKGIVTSTPQGQMAIKALDEKYRDITDTQISQMQGKADFSVRKCGSNVKAKKIFAHGNGKAKAGLPKGFVAALASERFSEIKPDQHTLLVITSKTLSDEERADMGESLGFTLSCDNKLPKEITADALIIDGRRKGLDAIYDLIDKARESRKALLLARQEAEAEKKKNLLDKVIEMKEQQQEHNGHVPLPEFPIIVIHDNVMENMHLSARRVRVLTSEQMAHVGQNAISSIALGNDSIRQRAIVSPGYRRQ